MYVHALSPARPQVRLLGGTSNYLLGLRAGREKGQSTNRMRVRADGCTLVLMYVGMLAEERPEPSCERAVRHNWCLPDDSSCLMHLLHSPLARTLCQERDHPRALYQPQFAHLL
jgi:hypothetical protein